MEDRLVHSFVLLPHGMLTVSHCVVAYDDTISMCSLVFYKL